MNNRAELLALAERVEAATGADRALDGLIWQAIDPNHDYVAFGESEVLYRRDPNDAVAFEGPPAFTASLDAAITLLPVAEAGYSATFWRVGNDGEGGNPADFKAEVLVCTMLTSQRFASVAATPALALTASSLRALAAADGESTQNKGNGNG